MTPFERADALVALAQQVLHGQNVQRTPTDLVVMVSAEALSGTDPVSVTDPDATDVSQLSDGTWLSAMATRRLACDCAVTEVVENERGTPISIGRKRRTISGSMKRALHRRDKSCRFPGCNTRVFLQGHHIEHWADGGATELRNLALLCSHHHRYLHEYGFTIKGDPAGELQFFDRRGRLVPDVPERPSVHDSGWPAILAGNTDLAITCDTPAYGWDGSRVDYSACIDVLLRADAGREQSTTSVRAPS